MTLPDPRLAILGRGGGEYTRNQVSSAEKSGKNVVKKKGEEKLFANLAWKACMSTPDLGKLLVPVPNLSFTD